MKSKLDSINNQSELIKIRDGSAIESEDYQRAKDKIRDIQLDTNNKQTASFEYFAKKYKNQTDKLNKSILTLTWIMAFIGILGLVLQVFDLSLSC